jgi:hypothetical protein
MHAEQVNQGQGLMSLAFFVAAKTLCYKVHNIMAKLFRPSQISQVVVTSKDGEVHMTIDLTINLNLNTGDVSIGAIEAKKGTESAPIKSPDFEWEIPDFDKDEKIEFGKKV